VTTIPEPFSQAYGISRPGARGSTPRSTGDVMRPVAFEAVPAGDPARFADARALKSYAGALRSPETPARVTYRCTAASRIGSPPERPAVVRS